MTSEQLTAILAERVMGWTVVPERFITGNRRWLPRWRFQPLANLRDAFRLLERAAATYTLTATANGTFTAHVSVGDRTRSASGKSKAATITVAAARAIGIDVSDELLEERKG